MKRNVLMGWMLTASLLLGGTAAFEASAQTRKGTTAKKTTTTTAKTGTKTTKTGTSKDDDKPLALTAKDISGKSYFQIQALDNTTSVVNFITFNANKTADWDLMGNEMEGSWSVANNTLSMKSGNFSLTANAYMSTSLMKGTITNGTQPKKSTIMLGISNIPEMTLENFTKAFESNGYQPILCLNYKGMNILVNGKIEIDSEAHKWKFVSNSPFMEALGKFKGTYEITDKGLTLTTSNDESVTADYSNYGLFKFVYNQVYVQGAGNVTPVLYLRK